MSYRQLRNLLLLLVAMMASSACHGQDTLSIPKNELLRFAIIPGFIGSLIVVWLTNFFTFAYSRKRLYLYYGLYGFALTLYYGSKIADAFTADPTLLAAISVIGWLSQPLFLIPYSLFMREFTSSHRLFPKIDSLLQSYALMLVLAFVMMAIAIIVDYWRFLWFTYNAYRAIAIVVAVILIFSLIRVRKEGSRAIIFIIYGSIALLVGAAMAMVFSFTGTRLLGLEPLDWMTIGILLELAAFSAGIGYKNLEASQTKMKMQSQLIEEMQKNEAITLEANQTLQQKIEEARIKIHEEERNKALTESSIMQLDTELQLLRAQMNPHFIFNSLNSIKSFIIKSDPRTAANYLGKFAYLMRMILSSSKESSVSLRQELATLKIYIELEQLRFKSSFDYEISVAPNVDQDHTVILPLTLQPYVENAIWHGLLHKEEKGKITIAASVEQGFLTINITDNGVGREKAAEIQAERDKKRKSYGSEITKKRLDYYFDHKAEIRYIDHDDHGGTTVVIKVPQKTR